MQIVYGSDGLISSADTVFAKEIDDVLNLNLRRLRQNRAEVIDSVRDVLNSAAGSRTDAELKKLIAKWERLDASGALPAYCDVAIFYLKKRLAKN